MAPRFWNALPHEVCLSPSLATFYSASKSLFFCHPLNRLETRVPLCPSLLLMHCLVGLRDIWSQFYWDFFKIAFWLVFTCETENAGTVTQARPGCPQWVCSGQRVSAFADLCCCLWSSIKCHTVVNKTLLGSRTNRAQSSLPLLPAPKIIAIARSHRHEII